MDNLIEIAKDKAEITIEKISAEKISLMTNVENMVISNDSELSNATDLLKKIKDKIKWLEEDRKSITGPINQSIKVINAKYKAPREILEKIRDVLDQKKIVPYSLEKIKKEREAEEKRRQDVFDALAKEQEAMDKIASETGSDIAKEMAVKIESDALDIAGQKTIENNTFKTGNTTNTLRGRWVCVVADDSLVPREYCEPSSKLLNEAVRNGAREINGCEIKEVFGSTTR